jgi:hypothetical protein
MPSTLSIVKFLLIYSIYLWFIPPIRQYKQRLFYYFLFLAFADPIEKLIIHYNISMPSNYYSTFSYLFLTAILWDKKSYKTNYYLIGGGLALFIFSTLTGNWGISLRHFVPFNFTYSVDKLLFITIQIIILFLFIKKFILDYVSYSKINVFQLVLVFYQLTVVSKIALILMSTPNALVFYIITSTIEIAFGLYFSIYREDKTKFPV